MNPHHTRVVETTRAALAKQYDISQDTQQSATVYFLWNAFTHGLLMDNVQKFADKFLLMRLRQMLEEQCQLVGNVHSFRVGHTIYAPGDNSVRELAMAYTTQGTEPPKPLHDSLMPAFDAWHRDYSGQTREMMRISQALSRLLPTKPSGRLEELRNMLPESLLQAGIMGPLHTHFPRSVPPLNAPDAAEHWPKDKIQVFAAIEADIAKYMGYAYL